MSKIITSDSFEMEVLKSDKPVLVDFFATWCGPCKMLAPVLDEMSEDRDDIKVVKLDVDQSMDLAQKYKVAAVPTLLLFKNGEVAKTSMGFMEKKDLEKFIDKA